MSLTLVTGPANSAKAQVVLERFRAALARSPILVVPRAADAEHYRRELAESGVVLGVRVEPFGGLMREIAARGGIIERPLGSQARAALIAAVAEAARLGPLADAARSPAFAPSLGRFVSELESRRIEPSRVTAALRAWAGEGSRRRASVEDLALLYADYRRRLERLGRLDSELYAVHALDAIALAPERWGDTPVFCYGFDDLEPLQLAAVETLAHNAGATVVISLPGEPGRVALAGRAATLETLRPGADEVIELGAQPIYYEYPALHHLERSLFEPPAADPAPADDVVRLLEGGDERAEAELIALEIAELLADGFTAGEIAVVTRADGATVEVLAGALDAFSIPYARVRRDGLATSTVGGGLLALLRCAAAGGESADLVSWLRVPGVVDIDGAVEAFEAGLRRKGIATVAAARQVWERQHGTLERLAAIERAARGGGTTLLEAIESELDALLAAPWQRTAALLDPWEAAAAAAARRSLVELRELARPDPRLLGGLAGVARSLEQTMVELPRSEDSGAVMICDALSLRARRVRALFIASLQDGVFPAATREPPLLGASERSELAQSSGLLLASPVDQLAAERYLFYALCSRPTARLRLSWHSTADDGEPALRSQFVDDLCNCFERRLFDQRRTRASGSLGWEDGAPLPAELRRLAKLLDEPRRRAVAIAALAAPDRLAALRARVAHSASGLESWSRCPVSWLVQHGLRARELAPDSIWLVRGAEAHRVLASVFEDLQGASGTMRLDAATLPRAVESLDRALAQGARPLSPLAAIDAAERRRLRLDLERYLSLAAAGSSRYQPAAVELAFGLEDDELPAVELVGGLALCGRIDRVDIDPIGGTAIVIDYKTGGDTAGWRTWDDEHKLQPALYMRAAERLLGVEAVGGLYQPLRGTHVERRL
ncbi:MAG TPA: PD-(D/E)XK nuclease family protein, partial [Solirubrobacteraceae bacterium]|nr:PD-(D/E)XK nuclease family protein [Solirubrobacteraceae bacterium]